ncbi:hypothetical protein [Streptomyces formicae]|uniref:Secreted protein n=1 Tax=Streptomyces formicae TaxID=1616117 RepID=A0ABY3WT49_9ACTN|nr:hypothetical protein [Streptomyces formicae]UNM14482.1 hypothetical protein J4032_26130 [Streptomyces formicae]
MLAVVVRLRSVVALVAVAVLKGVARRLVQSFHDDGAIINLKGSRRAERFGLLW